MTRKKGDLQTSSSRQAREEREAEALRSNLRRRKEQQRAWELKDGKREA